jgi:squalene/oxidosqualene cyclase-like protein
MFRLSRYEAVGLIAVAWFSLNIILFLLNQHQKKRKSWPPKGDAVTKLDVDEKATGWAFESGSRNKTLRHGNGIGRSWWMPPGKATAFPKFDRNVNPNSGDLIYRGLMMKQGFNKTPSKLLKGALFYEQLQTAEGFWPGDYGGPMFLLPGLVIAAYVTGVELGVARKQAMLHYILSHQHDEGGWGLHIEGPPTVFGSVLNYAAARLLGASASVLLKSRSWISKHGGALSCPQWGKFWLACLGVYEWTGVNPVPPEMWLLPNWFPLHPGKFWNHCRMVYLPMSALFGIKYVYQYADQDPVIAELRNELYEDKYIGKYESIPFSSNRETCSLSDQLYPQHWLMTSANWVLHHLLETTVSRALNFIPLTWLRTRGVNFAFDYIHAEDVHTNYVDVGPVSKCFHIIAAHHRHGSRSEQFLSQVERIDDYLWIAEDGMKMQGYNGSMFWDTCFATQAFYYTIKATKTKELNSCLDKCSRFIDEMQVKEDVWERDKYYRDKSDGGWPFSTRDHGWPISDCTAEGLKVCLILNNLSEERLEKAVHILLDLQNADNGWASYELTRGGEYLEYLNPAQVFGEIMIDYSYVECSSATIQALKEFASKYPRNPLASKCLKAATNGCKFLLNKQRDDGSWYGSWGVCFTYAMWFAMEGLVACYNDEFYKAIRKGCLFLIGHQSKDGSWNESIDSCKYKKWIPAKDGKGQVVQTAWALLALIRALDVIKIDDDECKNIKQACAKGVAFLEQSQLENGDWEQQAIAGVFNKSCAITYTAYRNVFPIWALAKYQLHLQHQ